MTTNVIVKTHGFEVDIIHQFFEGLIGPWVTDRFEHVGKNSEVTVAIWDGKRVIIEETEVN